MCIIRRHFWWVRDDSGGNVFFMKYGGPSGGSQQSGANVFFAKYDVPSGGSQQSGGKRFFCKILVAHLVSPCYQVEESLFSA